MADDSFDDFYARYAGRLLAFARSVYGRADADDIAQEAMTRAWRSYDALDAGRDPWPWLTAIARNVARDRGGGPRALPLADVPARQPDSVGAVEERQVLRAALGRLSSADRDVLVLRELHDLTFDELATLTGRSPNTVRQQAFRARQRLRAAYASVGGRAGAFLTGLRWRPWAEAQAAAAAVVVAGALATGGAPPPDPATPPQREVAAARRRVGARRPGRRPGAPPLSGPYNR
jgi:RNA polymerase sigma-70 factor (ECF subfamily)